MSHARTSPPLIWCKTALPPQISEPQLVFEPGSHDFGLRQINSGEDKAEGYLGVEDQDQQN